MQNAKRQSCGWHFRYRHPDIAGNWLAHVFTDNTNPLKIKKRVEFDCSWHLVSCPKEEEENLAKMECNPVTQKPVNIAIATEETGNRFTRRYRHCQDTRRLPLTRRIGGRIRNHDLERLDITKVKQE
ncbi:hypothetical protein T02_5457 [Trichinella nativa]|uniref:Uncharacterized protein n=1 Tax=Trichinella nativa TaxID=6335 RepID=A0A0V1LQJ6_9BILA|nr:hypothetical protein T02_5457 [Trichinella nativa]